MRDIFAYEEQTCFELKTYNKHAYNIWYLISQIIWLFIEDRQTNSSQLLRYIICIPLARNIKEDVGKIYIQVIHDILKYN